MINRKATIAAAVIAIAAASLTACSSGDTTASTPTATNAVPSASASASPTETAATAEGQKSQFTTPTTAPSGSSAESADKGLKGEEGYAWPKAKTALGAGVAEKFTEAKANQAWKEAVIFGDSVGWNLSLMQPDTPENIVLSAVAPYLTGDAFKKLKDEYPGYKAINKKIADGLDLTTYGFADNLTAAQNKQLQDWISVSSLISSAVPYLNEPEGVIEVGGNNHFAYKAFTVSLAKDDPDALLVNLTMQKDFTVKGVKYLKNGPVLFNKSTSYLMIPNDTTLGGDPGIPWLIKDWLPMSANKAFLDANKAGLDDGTWYFGI